MERKYSRFAIGTSLNRWRNPTAQLNANSTVEPQKRYSRLVLSMEKLATQHKEHQSDTNTTIFLLKSVPVIKYFFFRHYYLEFDLIEWHPGNPDGQIYNKKDFLFDSFTENPDLHSIRELCNKCAYKFMYRNFLFDKKFHFIWKNCQILFNDVTQTLLFLTLTFTLAFGIFFRSMECLLFGLIFLFSILFYPKHLNRIELKQCQHICKL